MKSTKDAEEAGLKILRKRGINFSIFKKRLRLRLKEEISEDDYVEHYKFMAAVVNLFKCKSVKEFATGHLSSFTSVPIKDKYKTESY